MFSAMDKLLLLGRGSTLFLGSAAGIVPYMKHIGVEVDVKMNPADFFML